MSLSTETSTEESYQKDLDALNKFVIDTDELEEMEQLLGGFNLFSVLGAENNELRHSNALAWFFDPTESHGLQDRFLRRWLMTVLHESNTKTSITPIDIDCLNLVSVEVQREWRHIDILLTLETTGKKDWVIAIENKVESTQRKNQLSDYRKLVEEHFDNGRYQHLFIFLTKNDEEPNDENYHCASYSQIHHVLSSYVSSSSLTIGDEPRVLINNYLRLLSEKFMNESEIADLALKIYQKHKRAIDIINAHKPDNLKLISDDLLTLLTERQEELGILMEPSTKSYIRFIPHSWNQAGNSHARGMAWTHCDRNIVLELNLRGSSPMLSVVSGHALDSWIDELWERSSEKPFSRKTRKERPKSWVTLHSIKSQIKLDSEDIETRSDIAEKIVNWIKKSLEKKENRDVISIIAEELPKLNELHTNKSNVTILGPIA